MPPLPHAPQMVYLVQMTSIDDLNYNLSQIQDLLASIKPQKNTSFVFLPENALYLRIKESSPINGIELSDPGFIELQNLAKQKNCYIHIGSSPIKDKTHLLNASVLVAPEGASPQITYEKLHLFDIQLENQKPIKESDVFRAGIKPKTLKLAGWTFGQSICYDLRFSELYQFYARLPVDALLIPSAFLVPTGQAHWHILTRARAIESQSFVIAPAQAGTHLSKGDPNLKRQTFGHSMIIDPWGKILAELSPDRAEIIAFELDPLSINHVRTQIPMHQHRKPILGGNSF